MNSFTDMDNNIDLYRRLYNFTLKELGEKLDLGLSNTRKLVRGEYDPRTSTLYKIAELFQIPVSEVYFPKDQRPEIRFDAFEQQREK